MNKLQWFVVAAMAFAFTGVARAEEKKIDYARLLIGTWEVEPKGADPNAPRILLEFSKDGKVKMIFKSKSKDFTIEGTYKLMGNKLETALKGPTSVNKDTVTITKITEKDLITTDSDGADLRLIRVK